MPLHVDHRDSVAILTLDDPERSNALGDEMLDEIIVTLRGLSDNPSVNALVVTGAGPVFCSGADVGSLLKYSGVDASEAVHVRRIYDGFLALRECELPTIAAVNGPAVGAGFNLALACDVRITSPAARFETRFATIGLHPGGGHVWMLERLCGPQTTAAMVAFGARIDGQRAVELGLAWRCVDNDALLDTAIELASQTDRVPRDLMVKVTATLKDAPWHASFESAVDAELERQAWSFEQGYLGQRVNQRFAN